MSRAPKVSKLKTHLPATWAAIFVCLLFIAAPAQLSRAQTSSQKVGQNAGQKAGQNAAQNTPQNTDQNTDQNTSQNTSQILAQTSLVSENIKTKALQLARDIAKKNLVLPNNYTDLSRIDKMRDRQKLRALRHLSSDAAMFRIQIDKDRLYTLYAKTATETVPATAGQRDLKLAGLFQLQNQLLDKNLDEKTRAQLREQLHTFRGDKDWYIANRAALLEASLQVVYRHFDIGLRDAHDALLYIPNRLGQDIDEAMYETYDFIAYLQFILNNLDGGLTTTAEILQKGHDSGRYIDGISLINNMAFAFNSWQEFDTAGKLAEILYQLDKANTGQGSGQVQDFVAYRYAQALNQAGEYNKALNVLQTKYIVSPVSIRKIGIHTEKAIAYAGLKNYQLAKKELNIARTLARKNNIENGRYLKPFLRAKELIALAEGDTITLNRLQTNRYKTKIQRLLRFQVDGVQALHAALENDKARQKERQDALIRERDLARAKAKLNFIAAVLLAMLALSLGIIVILLRKNLRAAKEVALSYVVAEKGIDEGERVKKQFLSVMSHEFRTPLNGIIAIADLLSDYGETQTLRDQNKIILESGENLLHLLTGILDMTHLDAGNLQLNAQPVNIRQICSKIYNRYAKKVDPSQVSFTLGIADDVPEQLMLDQERVTSCIEHVVSNGVKFTHKGRVHIHITMKDCEVLEGDHPKVKHLSVIVADTGVGIDEETRQKLFRPFTQADSSMTRGYGGAGIGLTVARGLARFMGGDIDVKTRAGFGSEFELKVKTIDAVYADADDGLGLTRFEVIPEMDMNINFKPAVSIEQLREKSDAYEQERIKRQNMYSEQDMIPSLVLPVLNELAENKRQAQAQNPPVSEETRAKTVININSYAGLSVLVVEDVLANQEVIRSILEPVGCQVTTSNNGRDALEIMKGQIFDVVLMDIRMPIMDGVEATTIIRQTPGPHQNVPIIALTADVSDNNSSECLAAGADVFLTKPVIVSELFSSIRFARARKLRDENIPLNASS